MRKRSRARDLLQHERRLHATGHLYIAGLDEAGRGCLAGPVFAAAVIFPPHFRISGVNDSKQLTADVREELFEKICSSAVAWAVASVEAEEIDRINIHHASLKAMRLAVEKLLHPPTFLLIDGKFPIPLTQKKYLQKAIIGGDSKSHTIAAASILAKVSRDRWITEAMAQYPAFNFKQHKGYGTREHYEEIKKNGVTPLHRRTFRLGLSGL